MRATARVVLAAPQVLVRLGVVMQLVAKMRLHALVSMTCIGCTSTPLLNLSCVWLALDSFASGGHVPTGV